MSLTVSTGIPRTGSRAPFLSVKVGGLSPPTFESGGAQAPPAPPISPPLVYIPISDTNGGGTTVRVRDVTGTEGQVEGLTPGVLVYTFSVTSENAVSFQDIDINARTTNTTATTEEGGRAACVCKLMVCSAYM